MIDLRTLSLGREILFFYESRLLAGFMRIFYIMILNFSHSVATKSVAHDCGGTAISECRFTVNAYAT